MRYLRHLLIAFFVLLGLVAAINGLMDATGLFGAPVIDGVNQVKTYGTDRFFKPLAVAVRQPRTVFVGTSRVAIGLDPRDIPEGRTYDLGLLGSTVPEHIAFARYAIDNAPVERLVYGLDFSSFVDRARYSSAFRLAILQPHAFLRALPDLLFSQTEMLQSRKTLSYSRHHEPPRYAPDGRLIAANERVDTTDPTVRAIRKIQEYTQAYRGAAPPDGPLAEFDSFLAGVPPRVSVYAFVTPAHATLNEALIPVGLTGAYQDWLRRVTAICAAHRVPLWDFNGYNHVTTEPLATSNRYFVDSAHAKPEVGALILATVLSSADIRDFGVRLTPEMLPGYLAAQQAAAETWRRDHPDDARLAAETAARTD